MAVSEGNRNSFILVSEAEGFKLLGAVNYVLKSIADDIIDPKLQLTAAFPLIVMVMQG